MTYALRAEWTKLRTVPSAGWSILAISVLTVVASGFSAASAYAGCPPPETRCGHDTAVISLSGVYLGQVAVVALGVLAMTGEYTTGMIRTTLAADPRRLTVFVAKAAVVGSAALAAAAVGMLGSLASGRIILPGGGFTRANGYPPLSLADEATRRAVLGSVLYLGLLALLSLGMGAAVRDTATAIATILSVLYVLPIIVQIMNDERWVRAIMKWSPMTAGLAVQATERLDALPVGPWAGLGIFAACAGGAVLLGAASFKIRDP